MQQILTWTTYSSPSRTFTSRHLSKHETRKQPTALVQQHHRLQQQTENEWASSATLPTHSTAGLFRFQLFSKPFWVSCRSAYLTYKIFYNHFHILLTVALCHKMLLICLTAFVMHPEEIPSICTSLQICWRTDRRLTCNKSAYNGNSCNGSCTNSSQMLNLLWNNSKVARQIVVGICVACPNGCAADPTGIYIYISTHACQWDKLLTRRHAPNEVYPKN